MKNKELIYYVKLNILLLIIWIVLMGKISVATLIFGVFIIQIPLYIAKKSRNGKDTLIHKFQIRRLIKYTFFLISEIYKSGFSAIGFIIKGRTNVGIVEINTCLNDEFDRVLLANSITLTPGTVTIDKKGSDLTVLWLDCITKDSQKAGDIIKSKYESILMED